MIQLSALATFLLYFILNQELWESLQHNQKTEEIERSSVSTEIQVLLKIPA